MRLGQRNQLFWCEFSTLKISQESMMGSRSWTALAAIALAVVVLFFALRGTHTDPASAPGREAGQAKNDIPSNPDTVTPRHPAQPQPSAPVKP